MARSARQSKILEIISHYDIETQDELVRELARSGYVATQATVSRDIKELNLVKTQVGEKNKYVAITAIEGSVSEKLLSVFRDTVLSVTQAKNTVVVKTIAQSAQTVGGIIQQMRLSDALGVLSSGETVLIVAPDDVAAYQIADYLEGIRY